MSPRILVVDDHRDCLDTLTALLSKLGCDVCGCSNGIDCLRSAIEFKPHCIILDLAMPDCDGFEVARQLRDSGLRLELVVLTGYGDDATRAKCREAGFDRFLLKPATLDQLRDLIAEVAETPATQPTIDV
jgi:CheY-like chemotaxis protein